MGLRPEVLRALGEMGFIEPMPVQRITFAEVMAGRDLMIQSRTGSGKTAAFGIPFAQGLVDAKELTVQALVLCPTRELALQVGSECTRIGAHVGMRVTSIYGGAPMGRQIEALKEGVQVVAGTPGRVLDHLRRGTLKLDGLKILVLDEADEMLSMGFYEEISEILKRCPPPGERQTMLFSATIPEEIERIGTRNMNSPTKVSLSSDGVGAREIHHCYYMVSGMGRSRDLVRILGIEKPESAIIFCNTREDTSLVAEFLRREGMDAEAISSDLTQKDRERVMGRMREGNLHYLVATDIAARGIDISDLSHVINFTFPESAEVYVHRTGRTGRAGKKGTAISLVSPRELGNFYYLKLTYKIRPEERVLPSEEEEATRRDGERMERLAAGLKGQAVSDEWRALARRVWAAEGGEAMVAVLIAQYLKEPGPALPVPSPTPEQAPSAEAVASDAAAEPTEREPRERRDRYGRRGERDDRRRRDRPGRDERSSARGGRDHRDERRPRRERPTEEPPKDRGAVPATISAPAGEPAPAMAPVEAGGAVEAAVPAQATAPSAAPVPAAVEGASPAEATTGERPKRERHRRRRRGEGGGSEARGSSSATSTRAPTIEHEDGREFWEVWVDDQSQTPGGAPAGGPARSAAPADRSESSEALPAGAARLYLNLGRRDGLKPDEIERWVKDRGAPFQSIQVRGSYSYLIVDDAQADVAIAALDRQRHGDRDLTCERARK